MAAVTRRQYKGAAAQTTITNALASGDTSATLAATTGWPSTAAVPFYVVISPGTASEEKCLATISGSVLTLTRAQDDTTAQSHASGATIYPVFSADDADEANKLASTMTTRGDLLTMGSGPDFARIAIGASGHVLKSDGTDASWAVDPATDLVTTKGDLLAATAADTLARLAAGTNEHRLVADSAQTAGLKYVADTTNYAVAAKGDLLVGTAADTVTNLGVGTNGHVLTAASGETSGVKWAAVSGGLTLISSTTIGSAVSSVEVTSAFSSTYANYRIVVSGGTASASGNLKLTLGATATGYYSGLTYATFGGVAAATGDNNATSWAAAGSASGDGLAMVVDLLQPNLAKVTSIAYAYAGIATTTINVGGFGGGFLNDTTQYTAFTIAPASGTLTGGTIRVYGYQNS